MFGLGWPESGLGDARIFLVYSTGGYAWRAEIYVNFLCILRVAMLGEAKYTAISCILRVAMLGDSPGYDSFRSSIVLALAIYYSFDSSIVPTLAMYDSFHSSIVLTLAIYDGFGSSIVPTLAK